MVNYGMSLSESISSKTILQADIELIEVKQDHDL